MKIKILKIKVTEDNQDFDFNDFFVGSNTIYTTLAQLIEEKDGLYWHAFITYKPQSNFQYGTKTTKPEAKELPEGFREEVLAFLESTTNLNTRAKNAIKRNLENVLEFKNVQDFSKVRSFGSKTLADNEAYLNEIIAISKKYSEGK